jgi:hypothetical protein
LEKPGTPRNSKPGSNKKGPSLETLLAKVSKLLLVDPFLFSCFFFEFWTGGHWKKYSITKINMLFSTE